VAEPSEDAKEGEEGEALIPRGILEKCGAKWRRSTKRKGTLLPSFCMEGKHSEKRPRVPCKM